KGKLEEEERKRKEEEERKRKEAEAQKQKEAEKGSSDSGSNSSTASTPTPKTKSGPKSSSGLIWPIDNARITSPFNPNRMHPIHNEIRPHNGMDMVGSSQVKAADSGIVTHAGPLGSFGNV